MSNNQTIKIGGIDIGLKGAIAIGEGNLITKEFTIIKAEQLPLTTDPQTKQQVLAPMKIYNIIPNDVNIIMIEKPSLKPFQSLAKCAENFQCLGYIEMALQIKRIAYFFVPSNKKIKTVTQKQKGKTTAILTCEKIFPYIELRGSTIKDRDNIAEAILLAYYGWLKEIKTK